MATLQLTHSPILNSSAQLLILPVNTAGVVLDSVLIRTKTLFPDNYQRYYRACRDGSLSVGSCLLHKRTLEQAGLGISGNGNQPIYIANLVVSDHPYHPVQLRGLRSALMDLQQQLIPLIRYQGIRRAALLARPLIFHNSQDNANANANANDDSVNTIAKVVSLDWHADVLPLVTQQLQHIPKLHIDIHRPKDIHM